MEQAQAAMPCGDARGGTFRDALPGLTGHCFRG